MNKQQSMTRDRQERGGRNRPDQENESRRGRDWNDDDFDRQRGGEFEVDVRTTSGAYMNEDGERRRPEDTPRPGRWQQFPGRDEDRDRQRMASRSDNERDYRGDGRGSWRDDEDFESTRRQRSDFQEANTGWRGDREGFYGSQNRGVSQPRGDREGMYHFEDRSGSRRERSRFFGRGPKNYARSDERIREDVSEALYRDGDVDASEIEVEVKAGEVTLNGTVEDRQMKRQAEECIWEVTGVKDVTNLLRVGGAQKGDGESRAAKQQNAEESSRRSKTVV